jgi:hypothetical protein
MADLPYSVEPEPEPQKPSEPGWGRLSTFVLGLAIGAVLGLAATPAGRGALVPVHWLAALGYIDDPDGPAKGPAQAPAVKAKAAVKAAARPGVVQVGAVSPAAPPPELRAPIAGAPMVVGVFGDSMADGLWAGLYRQLHETGGFDVVKFSQSSTGLARYDYVDMQEKTAEDLDRRHIDVAVLMVGTNDQQGISKDGQVYDFGTPGWRTIYEARVDALVTLLRSRGVAVYWVGLPKMERKGFDARATLVNSILAGRMAALGVPFIQTVPQTVNEQGQYDDYLAEPGHARKTLMRARDGIHMTMAGYMRIAAPMASRLRADVAAVSTSSANVVSAAGEARIGVKP